MESSPESAVANRSNSFLRLPAELILQSLSYLEPLDLVHLFATSRALRAHAHDDRLWQRHVNANLPAPLSSPYPLPSFKDLYRAHHPYWFLTRNQVWVSDSAPYGQLVVARYNPQTGCIEGNTVVAERGVQTHQRWDADPEVIVIGFEPQVRLHLDAPVLRLPADGEIDWRNEIPMDCASQNSPGLRNSFVFARDYPSELLTPGSAVWPSMNMPSPSRTRNLSASDFTASAHRPQKRKEISQSAFRIRKWVEYHSRRASPTVSQFQAIDRLTAAAGITMFAQMNGNSVSELRTDRRGDRVTTFGTLDPAAYTPTPQKPWRGIWSGDYSAHGVEYLLILQPDETEQFALPSGLNWLIEWLTGGRRQEAARRDDLTTRTYTRMNQIISDMAERDTTRDPEELDTVGEMWLDDSAVQGDVNCQSGTRVTDPEGTYTGKLVALKLTGDPNVPRGEISFIAPDLREGYVRTASDSLFKGARVVRAAGHIANHGFIFDEYIPSELILCSHDMLAQHWQGFGHISFFRRVDIPALLAQAQAQGT